MADSSSGDDLLKFGGRGPGNLEGRPGGELGAQQAEGAGGVSGGPAANGIPFQDGHVDAFPGQIIGDRATDHTGANHNYVRSFRQSPARQ